MNYYLILSDELLLVSDEEIKEGDYIFSNNSIKPIVVDGEILTIKMLDFEHWRKVIAGTPSLPKITLFEEAYKEMKERFGWVDVEMEARKYANIQHNRPLDEEERYYKDYQKHDGFIEGFKLCQSLNKSRFSDEDFDLIVENSFSAGIFSSADTWKKDCAYFKEELKKSLHQPKRVKVEVEILTNTIKITRLCK